LPAPLLSPPPPHSFPTRRSSDLLPVPDSPSGLRRIRELGLPAVPGDRRPEIGRNRRRIRSAVGRAPLARLRRAFLENPGGHGQRDRKSTCLNSSHVKISYAVFCL